MKNNMASSGLWKMLYLPKLLTTEGTTACVICGRMESHADDMADGMAM